MPNENVTVTIVLKDLFTKPAGDFRGAMSGIQGAVQRVQSALAPLTGRIASLTAAFAGFAGVRRALGEAKEAENALQRLRAALDGNEEALKRGVAQSKEVQKRTILGDDAIIQLAATLINNGVRVDQLTDAIEASVQTSAGLMIDLQSAGEAVARTYSGEVPRALGQSVRGLNDLSPAALKAGGALKVLIDRFHGQAEALTKTPTGQVAQAQERLANVFEDLGKVLVRLQAQILPALVKAMERLVETVSSPAFQQLAQIMTTIGVALIDNAGKIAVFLAALKGVSIITTLLPAVKLIVVAIGVALAAIFSPAGAIAVGIAVLATGILQLIEEFTGWRVGIIRLGSDAIDTFKGLWDTVKEGGLRFTEFVREVKIQLQILAVHFRTYLFDVPLALIADFVPAALELHDTFITKLNAALAKKVAGPAFIEQARKDADQAMALAKSGAAASVFAAIEEGRQQARDILEQSKREAQAAINDANRAANAAVFKQHDELEAKALADIPALLEKLDNVQKEFDASHGEEATRRRLKQLDREYSLRLISLKDFLERKDAIESQDLRESIERETTALNKLRVERESAQGLGNAEGTALMLRDEIAGTERLVKLKADLKELESSQQLRASEEAAKRFTAAQGELNDTLERNANLVGIAALSNREAQRSNSEAFGKFRAAIRDVREEYEGLIKKTNDPALRQRFEQDLANIEAKAAAAAAQIRGTAEWYARTIREGLEGPLTEFFDNTFQNINNLREAFVGFLNSVAGELRHFAASEAAKAFLDIFAGTADKTSGQRSGGLFQLAGGFLAGLFTANEGGVIPGGGPDRDSVLIAATPGERVIRRAAAQRSSQLLEAVNAGMVDDSVMRRIFGAGFSRLALPRIAWGQTSFNVGGTVGAATPSHTNTKPMPAIIIGSEHQAEQLLRGGRGAFLRFFAANREELKGLFRD